MTRGLNKSVNSLLGLCARWQQVGGASTSTCNQRWHSALAQRSEEEEEASHKLHAKDGKVLHPELLNSQVGSFLRGQSSS